MVLLQMELGLFNGWIEQIDLFLHRTKQQSIAPCAINCVFDAVQNDLFPSALTNF